MKSFVFLILLVFSVIVHAGGAGGGGGVRPEERAINPELILDFGRMKADPRIKIIHSTQPFNGVSRISVGRINHNKWQIQQFDVPEELLIHSDLTQEIHKSIELNDWVEIQSPVY